MFVGLLAAPRAPDGTAPESTSWDEESPNKSKKWSSYNLNFAGGLDVVGCFGRGVTGGESSAFLFRPRCPVRILGNALFLDADLQFPVDAFFRPFRHSKNSSSAIPQPRTASRITDWTLSRGFPTTALSASFSSPNPVKYRHSLRTSSFLNAWKYLAWVDVDNAGDLVLLPNILDEIASAGF